MKKFFKLFTILLCLLSTVKSCMAEEYKILVLPDSIQFECTNYYIYPDSSVMFASDTINCLKQYGGKVQTVSMGEVRDTFRANQRLKLLVNHALNEFKYNYNVDFVDLKKIANSFSVGKVLLISSTTDVQNYVLKRTIWDFLNIPGTSVVDPAYRLSTNVSLVDVEKEEVLWQQNYYRNIGAMENRMIAVGFAPASTQLEQIKLYSSFLSSAIAQKVQFNILPPPVLSVEGDLVNTMQEPVQPPVSLINTEIVKKPFVSAKPKLRGNGVRVNDI